MRGRLEGWQKKEQLAAVEMGREVVWRVGVMMINFSRARIRWS